MTKEPKYIAYRCDQKRFKEFYTLAEAANFFKCGEFSIYQKARGTSGSHMTGRKINQKWLIFHTDLPHKIMSEELANSKSEDYTWHYYKRNNGVNSRLWK